MITTRLVNTRENQLRKGYGYHLDLAIIAVYCGVCSCFGLPWMTAATVQLPARPCERERERERESPWRAGVGERWEAQRVRVQRGGANFKRCFDLITRRSTHSGGGFGGECVR